MLRISILLPTILYLQSSPSRLGEFPCDLLTHADLEKETEPDENYLPLHMKTPQCAKAY